MAGRQVAVILDVLESVRLLRSGLVLRGADVLRHEDTSFRMELKSVERLRGLMARAVKARQ
jgi:hypothetical protein